MPAEIRLEIFERSIEGIEVTPRFQDANATDPSIEEPALLRTCRRIRREAMRIFINLIEAEVNRWRKIRDCHGQQHHMIAGQSMKPMMFHYYTFLTTDRLVEVFEKKAAELKRAL